MLTAATGHLNYIFITILLLVGFYGLIATENLLKLMALNVVSVAIYYLPQSRPKLDSNIPVLVGENWDGQLRQPRLIP